MVHEHFYRRKFNKLASQSDHPLNKGHVWVFATSSSNMVFIQKVNSFCWIYNLFSVSMFTMTFILFVLNDEKLKRGLEVNQSWIIWELPFWPHFLKKNQIRKRTQQDREIKLSHRYGTNNSIMTLTLIALNITTCIKSYSILPMLKTVHSILSVGNFPYL